MGSSDARSPEVKSLLPDDDDDEEVERASERESHFPRTRIDSIFHFNFSQIVDFHRYLRESMNRCFPLSRILVLFFTINSYTSYAFLISKARITRRTISFVSVGLFRFVDRQYLPSLTQRITGRKPRRKITGSHGDVSGRSTQCRIQHRYLFVQLFEG